MFFRRPRSHFGHNMILVVEMILVTSYEQGNMRPC
jgi:hypothetical protein